MSVPVLTLFNNKGGVGKTSLTYHLAWMFADLGIRVFAADLDPQANLTTAFLSESEQVELWPLDQRDSHRSVYAHLRPLLAGTGDILLPPQTLAVAERITLLAGDLALSAFEDELSAQWPKALDSEVRAFRVLTAFGRLVQEGAIAAGAQVVLLDVGPNLGALNRAALIATDYPVIPLAPDLFSLQGLRNLGPSLRKWKQQWQARLDVAAQADWRGEVELTASKMQPIGYVVMQHAERLIRPVKAYAQWVERIPPTYRHEILQEPDFPGPTDFRQDPHCIGLIKHYRSLMPLAQEARKPIFHLRPADGAIGAHQQSVEGARRDFETLAKAILERCGIGLPGADVAD